MGPESAVFGNPIKLFKILGFAIRIDPSWCIVAALVTWQLSTLALPVWVPGRPAAVYWVAGVVAAFAYFLSVVLHELSHALVARRYGLEMRGITLFIFGGVAEMPREPPTAQAELLIAAAGPAASFGISLAFGAGYAVATAAGLPAMAAAVCGLLGGLNAMLALFNLVPAFPLDGGRVLRAVLWGWSGSLRRATRIASGVGAGFGLLLVGLGLISTVRGSWSGLWLVLVGFFVRNAAQASYQQLLLRRALEGEPVSRFMQTDPVTVPRAISVLDLVQGYVYRYHFKMFPVVDDGGRLLGCVTTRKLRELPREEWDRQTAGAVTERCGPENTVRADTDAMQALSTMSRTGASRLMVVDGDRLLGILSLKDLLRFFSLKMELEGTG